MSDVQDFQYDLFLSHASEDKPWCETLAERLRNEGVRVWFDAWEVQPGHNLFERINDGIKRSRKMVAIFSKNYFKDSKVWTRADQMIGKCFDKRVAADDIAQFLRQQARARKKLPRLRSIVISTQGSVPETRAELDAEGVYCTTYAELLRDLVPLDDYVRSLVEEYDEWREGNWQGQDRFVRPDVRQDITGEDSPARLWRPPSLTVGLPPRNRSLATVEVARPSGRAWICSTRAASTNGSSTS